MAQCQQFDIFDLSLFERQVLIGMQAIHAAELGLFEDPPEWLDLILIQEAADCVTDDLALFCPLRRNWDFSMYWVDHLGRALETLATIGQVEKRKWFFGAERPGMKEPYKGFCYEYRALQLPEKEQVA